MSMIDWLFLLCILLQSFEEFGKCQDVQILANKLQNIMEKDLGHQKIQAHFDDLSQGKKSLNGLHIIYTLKKSLESYLGNVSTALKSLKKEIEESFDKFSPDTDTINCCDVVATEHVPRFKAKVDYDRECVTLAPECKKNKNVSLAPKSVRDRMVQNFLNFPNLHRQYFGTEQGMWTLHPAQTTCSEYDPRFRPWYVQAATRIPKDIVIVLDSSQSMGNTNIGDLTLLQIAQKAVKTVLNTLTPSDRIGIVKFDDRPHKPYGCTYTSTCYQKKLALSTSINIKCLSDYMDMITAGGNTNYVKALQEAFNYFHEDRVSLKSRNQVILFVSDGDSSISNNEQILETIAENNHRLGNSVTILTFGIGEELDEMSSKLLKEMAEQTKTNSSYGSLKKGKYVQVKGVDRLTSTMAKYYEIFTSFSEDIVFSAPYYDIFSSGNMITASIPFFHNQTLKGVVGIDIIIDVLMNHVHSFNTRNSYAFVIDNNRRTLTHPLMPLPDKDNKVIVVNISSLERGSKQSGIINDMISGNDGLMQASSKYSIPKGNVLREGVITRGIQAIYYWRKVHHSNMSVCLVLFKESVPRIKFFPSKRFVFSRFDLKMPPRTCKYFGKLATTGSSVINFSPNAFEDEMQYRERDVDLIDLREWELYVKGQNINLHKPFKNGIREMISATEIVDYLWVERITDLSIHWRYIATTNGVMRTEPGVTITKEFDHTVRPWFIRALANPRTLVLSPPFTDKWSGKNILTLSKTLHHNNSPKDNDPIAVLSTDFFPSYFHSMIQESLPECQKKDIKCYIVDTSGYIVMSDEFIRSSCGKKDEVKQEYVHIIQKEPGVAKVLINNYLMIRQSCINIKEIKLQRYWRLGVSTTSAVNDFKFFRIIDIPKTNLLLIMRYTNVSTSDTCRCDQTDWNNPRCQSKGLLHCECPCYIDVEFDFCKNNLKPNRDNEAVCNPQPTDYSIIEPKENVTNLNECFNNVCSSMKFKYKCLQNSECNWCNDGAENNYCIRGKCNTCQIEPVPQPRKPVKSNRRTFVIVGCVVYLLILIIGIAVALKCLRFKVKRRPNFGRAPSVGQLNPAFDGSSIQGSHYEVPDNVSEHFYEVPFANSTLKSVPSDFDRRSSIQLSVASLPRPPLCFPTDHSWRAPRSRSSLNSLNGSTVSSIPSTFQYSTGNRFRTPRNRASHQPEEDSDVASSVNAETYRPQNPFPLINTQTVPQNRASHLSPIIDEFEPDERWTDNWSHFPPNRNLPSYPSMFSSSISSPQTVSSMGSSPFVYPRSPPPRYNERYFQFDC